MEKPSITFFYEKKPEHYVGSDIDIVLHSNTKLTDGEIENVMTCLQSGLISCDYPFEDEKNALHIK